MIVTAEQACQMAGEAIAKGHVFIAYPMGARGFSVFHAPPQGRGYVPSLTEGAVEINADVAKFNRPIEG